MRKNGIAAVAILWAAFVSAMAAEPPLRWWKGNLHTHSFWSDGDDFPEMIAAWYKERGYHFLAISDHNVLQQGQRWVTIGTNQTRRLALRKYLNRLGTNWVQTRMETNVLQARLKPLFEYQALFQDAGRFLLIQSEEITDYFGKLPVHMNATHIRELIKPQGGKSVREVMQNNVTAVLDQAKSTGQPMLPHLNHPNFEWGVTAEDLAAVRGERFFEVYNGHPGVKNPGDAEHSSTDRMWDIAIALRLAGPHPEALYGIGVDDSHSYHQFGVRFSNAGRGWIMIRSRYLTPEHLLAAMERGDFYASSGVTIQETASTDSEIRLSILTEKGVQYRTEFIGTRRGFDVQSEPVKGKDGQELPVTRRYSPKIGEVLAVVDGPAASYRFKGDELYVRARVTSTKDKVNPSREEEKEMAWTQPIYRN